MSAQPPRADLTERPRLAFVGIGRMGLPMCARLVAAGFQVTATDLRRDLRGGAQAVGARWADSIPAACAEAGIAITMLPGAREVQAAAAEIAGSLAPGACWLDMSTASPQASRQIAPLAGERGVCVLEAPVGGGPDQARDGHLLAFAGGRREDVARCRPVLDVLCARVLQIGPAGAGYTVKLLVNLLWFGQAVATAEALALAGAAGLDLDVVHDALRHSAASSRFIAEHVGPLLEGDDLPAFPLVRCCEELESVLALGAENGVPLDLATVVSGLHRQALKYYGNRDGELLGARYVAGRGGIELSRRPRRGDR
jgi:3-hydroxyisobutyrate dehydrogenase-like beta-hydroxyacid dehydrogenase